LIEWSEKAETLLPQNKYLITITASEENEEEREIVISGSTSEDSEIL
jgi:tRNA A37 threonylcarbamoyladenosine biosynthesis protein TsaE